MLNLPRFLIPRPDYDALVSPVVFSDFSPSFFSPPALEVSLSAVSGLPLDRIELIIETLDVVFKSLRQMLAALGIENWLRFEIPNSVRQCTSLSSFLWGRFRKLDFPIIDFGLN